MDLSLILPCYNEEKILEKNFQEIIKILEILKCEWEIIFVDDKSTDNTIKIIEKFISNYPNIKLITHQRNMGRGKTVVDGIINSSGKIVGYMDIDLEIHARYIPSVIAEIKNGADIVNGYRFYKVNLSNFHRFLLSRGYNFMVRKFLKLPFLDTEAGFKFFKREAILFLIKNTTSNHWFWDTEIMAYAFKYNFKIVNIPVLFIKKPEKKSTVNITKDTFYYLNNIIKFKKKFY